MSRSEAAGLAELLMRAGQAVGSYRRRAAATHGLSTTAMGVLAALSRSSAVSHRDLAARLGVSPATLTPVVDILDADGDLTRVRDPVDRRVVRLSITDSGRTRIAAASTAVEEAVAERMPRAADEHLIREHLLAVLTAFDDGGRGR